MPIEETQVELPKTMEEKVETLATSQSVHYTLQMRQEMRLQETETQVAALQKKLVEVFQGADEQLTGIREALREIIRRVDAHTQILSKAIEDDPTPDEE
jgi:biopolymer transport protein ExbD